MSRTRMSVRLAAGGAFALAVGMAAPAGAADRTGTESTTTESTTALVAAPRLPLTETAIGSASMPATLYAAKKNVNAYLGYSDGTVTDAVEPCLTEVSGQKHWYSSAVWDQGLRVVGASTSRPVRIDSYVVTDVSASRLVTLPYKVGVGNSVQYLRARAGWMRVDDSRVFNDGRIYSRGKVYWFMNPSGTRVDEVYDNPSFCD